MNTRNPLMMLIGLTILAAPLHVSAATAERPTADVDVAAEPASTDEVVFHWTKSVGFDGSIDEHTLVTTAIDRLDAGDYWIDLGDMRDSDGRKIRMEADAWQAEGDARVHYAMKLVAYTPTILDHDSRARRWAEDPQQTGRDFDTFLADKRAAAPPTRVLVDGLDRWMAKAKPSDAVDVVVMLAPHAGPSIPQLAPSLFEDEPALALALLEDRIFAIEDRKNAAEAAQRPVVDGLRKRGATIHRQYWLTNGFEARLRPSELADLARDPSVRRIERRVAPTADVNNLDDMRAATQIAPLHAAGYTGETASGASLISDIHIGIIDDSIDENHPAWNDTAGGTSRLVDIWRQVGGVWGTVATSAVADSHGTKVAGVALADLMQGQDAAYPAAADRDDRTGFAPEASFSFFESSAGTSASVEQAVSESVDIINLSISSGYTCDVGHSTNDAVDAAMLAGIFVAKSAGSNGAPGPACNIGNPGTASGAFAVTAYDRTAVPLVTGTALGSHGPDTYGRAVVALAAPAGTEGSTTAGYNNGYGAFGATSAAAPVIAGSAAVLKNHLAAVFDTAVSNEVGYLYASMLMMTDGEDDGGYVGANAPLDDAWGAGRFRARMLSAAGMDAPWRMRLIGRTISDGEVANDLFVNPDAGGVNQPLSADVDRLRAGIYWHEPNLEAGAGDIASIRATMCWSNGCYLSGTDSEERQRLLLTSVAGGKTWAVNLTGLDVPDSLDPDYHFGLDERAVFVAVYFEDGDRDDGDGPTASIQ